MDDNKVLVLMTSERIPLTPSMRVIIETSSLEHASPATVSRCGIVVVSADTVGWRSIACSMLVPFEDSAQTAAALLQRLELYVFAATQFVTVNCARPAWLNEMSAVALACNMLCSLLGGTANRSPEVLDALTQFTLVWVIGGALKDAEREQFDRFWREELGTVCVLSFPHSGSVFDFFLRPTSPAPQWAPFGDIVPPYVHEPGEGDQRVFVPTLETARVTFLAERMIDSAGVLLLGGGGTAKTLILAAVLRSRPAAEWATATIGVDGTTRAEDLQEALEAPLEVRKRVHPTEDNAVLLGAPGSRRVLYFIDDLSSPPPKEWGVQPHVELLRQMVDRGGFYDLKTTLHFCGVDGARIVAAMNPMTGSATIEARMQRHLHTIRMASPGSDAVRTIFGSVLRTLLQTSDASVRELAGGITDAAVAMHFGVVEAFVPSVSTFLYRWDLRCVSAMLAGLLTFMRPAHCSSPLQLARLWLNETRRVYADRLMTLEDASRFDELLASAAESHLASLELQPHTAAPDLFSTFLPREADHGAADGELSYLPAESHDQLRALLEEQQARLPWKLIMTNYAVEYICRITRILQLPRSHAMLIGVGMSGPKPLLRLAALVEGFEYAAPTVSHSCEPRIQS